MRVGGVGEGLFLKCLTDKNWFHIRAISDINGDGVINNDDVNALTRRYSMGIVNK